MVKKALRHYNENMDIRRLLKNHRDKLSLIADKTQIDVSLLYNFIDSNNELSLENEQKIIKLFHLDDKNLLAASALIIREKDEVRNVISSKNIVLTILLYSSIICVILGFVFVFLQDIFYVGIIFFAIAIFIFLGGYSYLQKLINDVKKSIKTKKETLDLFLFYQDRIVHIADNRRAYLKENILYSEIDFVSIKDNNLYLRKGKNGGYLPFDDLNNQHLIDILKYSSGRFYYYSPSGSVKSNKIRKASLILYIINLVTFFASFFLIVELSIYANRHINEFAYVIKNFYILLFFLPVPIINILFAIYGNLSEVKTTKNLISGIVFTLIISLFGSFTFIYKDNFIHDEQYYFQICEEIGLETPAPSYVETMVYRDYGDITSENEIMYYRLSHIKFSESDNEVINKNISNNDNFTKAINYPYNIISPNDILATEDYDYYLLFNVDDKTFNNIDISNGEHHMIYFSYDYELMIVYISDYYLNISNI